VDVSVAYYRDTHIHPESGLDRALAGLEERVTLRYLEPCLPRAMPYWVTRRLAPPFGQHSRMPFYEPSALPLEYGVMRKLVTSPGDVVHMFTGEPHFNYTAWVRHWPRRGALVVSFHQPPEKFEEVWRFKRKRARLDAIDAIIVSSTPQLEYFRAMVGDRVTRVPLGTNRRVFNPPAERPERDEVRCISVGGWLRDAALLRRTIERVARETDRVSFTVLAPRDYLESVGEPPRTRLASDVTGGDLVTAYHEADVFIHPARLSTASTAMLEAMSCGLPVVVPDVGGVREYADESCAEIVPPSDSDAMAESILRLAADPERRRRMGARSDERTRALDWPYIAHEWVQVYQRALASRAARG
jgi:glycosyltransferase involved in cell wall biosynthesis